MSAESEAHETLDLLFKRDGVPRALISNSANALIQGEFWKKARAAGAHYKETEPYSPFSNRAEACHVEDTSTPPPVGLLSRVAGSNSFECCP